MNDVLIVDHTYRPVQKKVIDKYDFKEKYLDIKCSYCKQSERGKC